MLSGLINLYCVILWLTTTIPVDLLFFVLETISFKNPQYFGLNVPRVTKKKKKNMMLYLHFIVTYMYCNAATWL